MNILFIGDVVGKHGRNAVKEMLARIKGSISVDICIANGENAAAGSGITPSCAMELFDAGVNVITMGNHTWSKRDIISYIEKEKRLIRPVNYPEGSPGTGSFIADTTKGPVGIINVIGRVYMDYININCFFTKTDEEIMKIKKETKVIIVDMHAEATSEKIAFGRYLDGRVTAVVGTHTHVQTADEEIFQRGTGYITDVGMTGPKDGILGMNSEVIINKFLTGMPGKFDIAEGRRQFCAVLIKADPLTGKCLEIKRINEILNE